MSLIENIKTVRDQETPTKPVERVMRYTTEDAPTIRRFHHSREFVRGIKGPVGSGKSTACCVELLTIAQEQKPSEDNIRYTRFAVIRNTYPELKTTTIKTWTQWCPERFGKLTWSSPIRHYIKVPPGKDGTPGLDMEYLFLALDKPDDLGKLLSLELTAAWVNEAREVPKMIIDGLTTRVGRYPSKSMGGCTWNGVIMDTNPPDDQNWWYHFAEEEVPEYWQFFSQPSGRSPEAENLPNLPDNYYKKLVSGKDEDFVKVYVDGEYGFVNEGKSVFPMYRDATHASDGALEPVKGLPLFIGVDFGLTPAAVIGQKLVDGRWYILDEYCTIENEISGVINFAKGLGAYMATNYGEFKIQGGFGDPAGTTRGSNAVDERTALELMDEYFPLDTHDPGLRWREAPSNDPLIRVEAVKLALNRLIDGRPGLTVSPKAKYIRKGFAGGYHYKFLKTGDGTQVQERPNKNSYSHPMDALQYLLLGGGEHNVVFRKHERNQKRSRRPVIAKGVDGTLFGE